MKQQLTNVLSLVDTKNVKAVLNSSQWDFERQGQEATTPTLRYIMNRLEKGLFSEKAIFEKLSECRMYDSSMNPNHFDDYYNEVHCYNESEELNVADLIDNVNYWFAQFIAGDMAASLIPSEHQHVLQSYTFFIK